MVAILKGNGAEALLLSFDKDSETPELIWDGSMRTELRVAISGFMDIIFNSDNQRVVKGGDFTLPPAYKVKHHKLENELCIGGVYVRLYLKDPSFQLSDQNGFLEALLLRWSQELELSTRGFIENSTQRQSRDLVTAGQDVIELVTSAIVCTCRLRPFLCEKLSSWGYGKTTINFLHKTKSMQLVGSPLLSTIRLLHILSSELSNVENIVTIMDSDGRHGVVDGIMKAIDGDPLHPESGYMIEALKKVFQTALGDVEKGPSMTKLDMPISYADHAVYAMAPSPAPGTDPVSKLKKVNADHPLAMMFGHAPVPKKTPSKALRTSVKQGVRRPAQPVTRSSLTTPSQQIRDSQLRSTFKSDQVIISNSHSNTANRQENSHGSTQSAQSGHNMKPSYVDSSNIQSPSLTRAGTMPNPQLHQVRKEPSDIQSSPLAYAYGQQRNASASIVHHAADHHVGNLDPRYAHPIPPTAPPPLLWTAPPTPIQAAPVATPPSEQNTLQPYPTQTTTVYPSLPQNIPPFAVTGEVIHARSPADPSIIADEQMKTVAGAPNSARGRSVLLASALRCGLPQFLVDTVLENCNLGQVRDVGAVKMHAVELLQLLLKDPGYGMKFELVLDAVPSWQKYKSQDHALFSSDLEGNGCNLLTGGSDTKMLTY